MAAKKQQATPELVALFKLQFYRRQNNWKFCGEVKKKLKDEANDEAKKARGPENEESTKKTGDGDKNTFVEDQEKDATKRPRQGSRSLKRISSVKVPLEHKEKPKIDVQEKDKPIAKDETKLAKISPAKREYTKQNLETKRTKRDQSLCKRNTYNNKNHTEKESAKLPQENKHETKDKSTAIRPFKVFSTKTFESAKYKLNKNGRSRHRHSKNISFKVSNLTIGHKQDENWDDSVDTKEYSSISKTLSSEKNIQVNKNKFPSAKTDETTKWNLKRNNINVKNITNKEVDSPQLETDENWEDIVEVEPYEEKILQNETENHKPCPDKIDYSPKNVTVVVATHDQKLKDLSRFYQMHIIDMAEKANAEQNVPSKDHENMPKCAETSENFEEQERNNEIIDFNVEWLTSETDTKGIWREWMKEPLENIQFDPNNEQRFAQKFSEINQEQQLTEYTQIISNYEGIQPYETSNQNDYQYTQNALQIYRNSEDQYSEYSEPDLLNNAVHLPQFRVREYQPDVDFKNFEYVNLPDIDSNGYEGCEAEWQTEAPMWGNQRICGEILRELEALVEGSSEPASPALGRLPEGVPREGLLEWLLTKAPKEADAERHIGGGGGGGLEIPYDDESMLEFMRGAHCNPHSTEVEVDPAQCAECECEDLRAVSTGRAVHAGRQHARALHAVLTELSARSKVIAQREMKARALTYHSLTQYDSSTEEYPTRDIGLHRPSSADCFLAGSHYNNPEYDIINNNNIIDNKNQLSVKNEVLTNDPKFGDFGVVDKMNNNDPKFGDFGVVDKMKQNDPKFVDFGEVGKMNNNDPKLFEIGVDDNKCDWNSERYFRVISNDDKGGYPTENIKGNELSMTYRFEDRNSEMLGNKILLLDGQQKYDFDETYVNYLKKDGIGSNYLTKRHIVYNQNAVNCFQKDFDKIHSENGVTLNAEDNDYIGRGRGRLHIRELSPTFGVGRGRI